MTAPVRLGLIGIGRWGRRYIETIAEMPDAKLVVAVGSECASSIFCAECIDASVDGLIVATGPDSHVRLATEAVEYSIPVMVEKPLALRVADIEPLQAMVRKMVGVPVLVDHVQLFSNDFENCKAKANLWEKRARHIDIEWIGAKPKRTFSSLYDYGAHVVAMALDLVPGVEPTNVLCQRHEQGGDKETWRLTMQLGECAVKAEFGRLNEGGATYVHVWDANENVIFEYGKEDAEWLRRHPTEAPLRRALDAFVRTIRGQPDPRVGLDLALRVTRVLEECAKQVGVA
jgi:predicted dehydrogenase